jgi:uncharacterized membrane protein (UPF0127 family)
MRVRHKKSGNILAKKMRLATSIRERTLGLMFMEKMNGFDGLMLDPCRSIHNFFVRFPIDVIFLDRKNQVVKVIKDFKPWRVTGIYFSAQKTLELPSGTISFDIERGDLLEISDV